MLSPIIFITKSYISFPVYFLINYNKNNNNLSTKIIFFINSDIVNFYKTLVDNAGKYIFILLTTISYT